MIVLIAALHKHHTSNHDCVSIRETQTFIVECLLLCRTIHYPPFPGGSDGDRPFYTVTRVMLWEAYSYFSFFIFRPLDERMGHRVFDTIRCTDFAMSKQEFLRYASRVYHNMEDQGILPPALVDTDTAIPPGI